MSRPAWCGVGARLDDRPELLFQLRAVDQGELVAEFDATLPLSKTGPAADKVLAEDDLSALFELDLVGDERPIASSPKSGAKGAGRTVSSKGKRKKTTPKE